jgi:hypothetical protein
MVVPGRKKSPSAGSVSSRAMPADAMNAESGRLPGCGAADDADVGRGPYNADRSPLVEVAAVARTSDAFGACEFNGATPPLAGPGGEACGSSVR